MGSNCASCSCGGVGEGDADADADAGSGELGSYAEVDPSVSPPNNDILVSYNIEGKVGGVGEFEAHFVVVEW